MYFFFNIPIKRVKISAIYSNINITSLALDPNKITLLIEYFFANAEMSFKTLSGILYFISCCLLIFYIKWNLMSWKYYNIFYISSKSSNLYPNNASHLHLFFLNDQKKDAIVVLASFFPCISLLLLFSYLKCMQIIPL